MPATATFEDLSTQLRGDLITPESAEYNDARKIYNAMIDKKPALIARCRDVADVIAAVNYGRDNNLAVAIRGGSHNVGGFSMADDGLVIDLSLMRWVRVDAKAKTARVGGLALEPGARFSSLAETGVGMRSSSPRSRRSGSSKIPQE